MFPNKRYNRKPPFNRATNNSQKKIEPHHFEISPCYGYFGYQLYFMDKDSDVDTILKNVCSFESYIHRNKSQFSLAKIKENLAFVVDLKTLTSDEEFDNEWVGFKEDIIEKTEFCLSCMGLAMHQTVLTEFMKPSIEEADGPLNVFHTLRVVRCRLSGHEPIVGIKNLRVSSYAATQAATSVAARQDKSKTQAQTYKTPELSTRDACLYDTVVDLGLYILRELELPALRHRK